MNFLSTLNNGLVPYSELINAIIALATSIAALGTLGAVIVSIRIAARNTKPQITAYAQKSHVGRPNTDGVMRPADHPSFITVSIINTGLYPVYIPYLSSFIWHIPFCKMKVMQCPETDYRNTNSLELSPGKSIALQLSDMASFEKLIAGEPQQWHKKLCGVSIRFLKLTLRLEDGRKIKVKLGKEIYSEIKNITSRIKK